MMEQKIVHEFSRLRMLSHSKSTPISDPPPSPSSKKKKLNVCKKMDALVHDLNTALELEEINNSSANAGSGSAVATTSNARRKVWRRRCKSTSNLSSLNLPGTSHSTELKKNVSQNSEDSSSSTDDTRAVILTNDRGTSSLQLSDSDDEKFQGICYNLCIVFFWISLSYYYFRTSDWFGQKLYSAIQ